MSENNFWVSHEDGRQGELYAQKHLGELISSVVGSITDTSAANVEGKDFVASLAKRSTGGRTDAAVEVKTVRGFLFRTNDSEEQTGTIGFELWKSQKRKTPGWLLQMLCPDGKKAVRPDILIFLLIAYDRVFASIAFEDVPALLDRLEKLSGETGFSLHDIPAGDPAADYMLPSGLLIENMWMIPLEKIQDLAHVVMIGEQPRLRPDIKAPGRSCPAAVQRSRYDNLLSLAQAAVPDDGQFVFRGNKTAQTITVASRNLDVLDRIRFDRYEQLGYMNRNGNFARLWEGFYQYMLSREYPAKEYKGKCYYPISCEAIARWGYSNGYRSYGNTWLNFTKQLHEFGLLKQYKPQAKNTDPADAADPKGVEYCYPVELTEDALLNADRIAEGCKRNKRKTSSAGRSSPEMQSGPETAGALQDDRILTRQDRFVRTVAERLLKSEVKKNNYITVDAFYGKLWKTVTRTQKLKKVDHAQKPEERKEQQRYRKYWHALTRLKKESKEFVNQMRIYKLGPAGRKDRDRLGEIPYGTDIITFRKCPDRPADRYRNALQKDPDAQNAKRRAGRKVKKV